jgi:Tol biopolymer transport system component
MTAAIHIVSPLGGVDRRLSDAPAALSQIAWSPDGRWLAAALLTNDAGQASRIYLVPAQGGERIAITAPTPPGFDLHPAFSPDGRRLAYVSCAGGIYPPCDISIVDLGVDLRPRTPPRQRLTRKATYPISGLAWTRDAQSLVFSAQYGLGAYLWRVRAEGDSPEERIELAGQGAYFPVTVAANDRLAFARSLWNNDIYRFVAGRPAKAVLASSYHDHDPSISPDGRRIAFQSGRSGDAAEIWLAGADGSNPVQLTRGPGYKQGSPRLVAGRPADRVRFPRRGAVPGRLDDRRRRGLTSARDERSRTRGPAEGLGTAAGSITGETIRAVATSTASRTRGGRRSA